VGSPHDLEGVIPDGSVYIDRHDCDSWLLEAKLHADDATSGDGLGSALSFSGSGDQLLVSGPGVDGAGDNSGAAYVFQRESGQWTQEAKLIASDGAAGDVFGISAALSAAGDLAVVGAVGVDVPAPVAGAAYVFRRTSGGGVDPGGPPFSIGRRLVRPVRVFCGALWRRPDTRRLCRQPGPPMLRRLRTTLCT